MTIESDRVRFAVLALAARRHGVVTRRQAGEMGFGRRRVANALRSGLLAEPIPGVLVVCGHPSTWHQRLATVVLAAGTHGAASHRSAARLHRLDGFDGAGNAVVEASVDRRHRLTVDVPAVIHHVVALEPHDLTVVDGIASTTLARTLADLGSVVRDRRALRRALTSARRRGASVELVREVARRLHRPGQAGTAAMLRLLDSIPFEGVLPDSWFEELLALCLDDPELPPFEAQYRIRDAGGAIVARVDIGFRRSASASRPTAAASTSVPTPAPSTKTATSTSACVDGS